MMIQQLGRIIHSIYLIEHDKVTPGTVAESYSLLSTLEINFFIKVNYFNFQE